MTQTTPQPSPPLHRLKSTDSTNSEAFRLAEQGAPHQTVVVADYQTAGRGQPGREWWMPPREGILLSMLLRQMPPGVEFEDLTRRTGLVIARILHEFTKLRIDIKPPNDLMIEGKKIGGILCEARWSASELQCAVIGVGVNVNVASFPAELVSRAASLAQVAGHPFDIDALIQSLAEGLRRFDP